MQWERPESVEILLGCEIGNYEHAELPTSMPQLERAVAVRSRTVNGHSLRTAAE
jgi:hypothetical protein